MPAGLRVTALNPNYADAGDLMPGGPSGSEAITRLNNAVKEGILTYDEVLKGLTVKPLEVQKNVLTLQDQINEGQWRKENAPGLNVLRANELRRQTAEGALGAAEAEARQKIIGEEPGTLENLARKKLSITNAGLDADRLRLDNVYAQEERLRQDPEGLVKHYADVIGQSGLPYDSKWDMETKRKYYNKATQVLEKRHSDALYYKAWLDRIAKTGESKDAIAKELRNDFTQDPVIKEHSSVMEATEKIGEMLKQEHTPYTDMVIVFSYMKMLDSNSTVRESEYTSVKNAKGGLDYILDLKNNWVYGMILDDKQREGLKAAVDGLQRAHNTQVDKQTHFYRERAEKLGIDPEQVISGGWRKIGKPEQEPVAAPETRVSPLPKPRPFGSPAPLVAPVATPAPAAGTAPVAAPATDYGYRGDGTAKGPGFLGPLKNSDGRISTELSIGVDFDGKETEIPSLVPTLTEDEKVYLLKGGKPTIEIVKKAVDHAKMRMSKGLPVFATQADTPAVAPVSAAPAPAVTLAPTAAPTVGAPGIRPPVSASGAGHPVDYQIPPDVKKFKDPQSGRVLIYKKDHRGRWIYMGDLEPEPATKVQ